VDYFIAILELPWIAVSAALRILPGSLREARVGEHLANDVGRINLLRLPAPDQRKLAGTEPRGVTET